MSTVYSVRIPKKLKEALESLDGVDWQGELRAFLEKKVRQETMAWQLDEGRKLRSRMRASISAAEMVREDRKNAH